MNAVVDASVVVAALVDSGEEGDWAEQVIGEHALFAPELLRAEAMSVLRRLEGTGQITGPEANAAQADLMELEVELFPFEPFAARVWQLRHAVTSYDGWYVAVAEALGIPLATLDQRLARSPGLSCALLTPSALRGA